MFLAPYQTSVLSSYNTAKVKMSVEQLITFSKENLYSLVAIDGKFPTNVLVLQDPTTAKDIPLFTQPLEVKLHNDETTFITDCRSVITVDNMGQLRITKPHIYQINVLQTLLTNTWKKEGVGRFTSINKFPVKVFSNWLTAAVARKLNIDEIAQVRANVIFAYFFLCMFEDLSPYDAGMLLDEDKAYSYAIKISYATGLNTLNTLNIIKEIPTMSSVYDLEKAMKEHGGSERFKLFNVTYLYTLISRTALFGVPVDMVYAAVEHPPTFYTMIFTAAVEKGHNKSEIGNIIHNNKNNDDLKNFVQMMKSIIRHS